MNSLRVFVFHSVLRLTLTENEKRDTTHNNESYTHDIHVPPKIFKYPNTHFTQLTHIGQFNFKAMLSYVVSTISYTSFRFMPKFECSVLVRMKFHDLKYFSREQMRDNQLESILRVVYTLQNHTHSRTNSLTRNFFIENSKRNKISFHYCFCVDSSFHCL